MAASLCEEYRNELQHDGSILLVPEDYSRPTDTNPDIKSEALRVCCGGCVVPRCRAATWPTCCPTWTAPLVGPMWPRG